MRPGAWGRGNILQTNHRSCIYGYDFHVIGEQLARISDVNGSLLKRKRNERRMSFLIDESATERNCRTFSNLLVPGHDPDDDAGISQGLDALGNALLQPVLDPRCSEQLHVRLHVAGGLQQQFFLIVECKLRLLVLHNPLFVFLFGDDLSKIRTKLDDNL